MNNKYLVLLVACILIAMPGVMCQVSGPETVKLSDLKAYNKWSNTFKRVYLNEEEQIYRQLVFFENLQKIHLHSQNSEATFTVGLNKFSDYTTEEFVSRVLNKHIAQNPTDIQLAPEENGNLRKAVSYPASVDWRNSGALNPIQDQGQCGSCATFGTAGVLEAFNFIKNNKLVKFSEQQLLDCARQAGFDTYGCDGAWQQEYFKYAIKVGIVPGANYPYVGYQTTCKNITNYQKYFPKSFKFINPNASDLKNAIAQGPVSVTVDASTWSSYSGGIFNGCSNQITLNHAVIAVGYDVNGNYIIRNSWNTYWGENGYMRLSASNNCGVLTSSIQVLS